MIDEKKIEEAAKVYAKKTEIECRKLNEKLSSGNKFSVTYKNPDAAFTDGAHWAIEEFSKDLLHDASEEPKSEKRILVEMYCNNETNYLIREPRLTSRWEVARAAWQATRWLYIDDLFKKGGKK